MGLDFLFLVDWAGIFFFLYDFALDPFFDCEWEDSDILGESGNGGKSVNCGIGELGKGGIFGESGKGGILGESGKGGILGESGKGGILGESGKGGIFGPLFFFLALEISVARQLIIRRERETK